MGRSEKQNVKSLFYPWAWREHGAWSLSIPLFYLFTAIMPHARIGSQDKYISAPTYSNMLKTENFSTPSYLKLS
jgi:hypothetical protein